MPYNHLTLEERYEIKHLAAQKYSIREIGRMLGRSHSTISRELRRNASRNNSYCASKANEKYRNRRVACRREPLYMHQELMTYLVDKLAQYWSPQQIAGRLPLDFPEAPHMRISHESIYRWLYDLASLRPFLGYLRRRHKKRRKRNGRKVQRVSIPNRVGIEQRPKLVETQERFGDWEADLVLGAHQEGAIVTLVERKSMLLRVGLVASKHAEGVAQATIDALLDMPKSWVRTMTFDNGKEFAAHEKIATWGDGRGRTSTAPLSADGKHIQIEACSYTAEYRTADGRLVRRSTGCRSKEAAMSRMKGWVDEQERVKSGILTTAELNVAQWADVPLTKHIEAFKAHMQTRGRTAHHIQKTERYIIRVCEGCSFRKLRDLTRQHAERWVYSKQFGARVHNGYATALISFGNYLLREQRTTVNPFIGFPKKNEATDRRHVRRVLSHDEATALIAATEQRLLHEALHKNRGSAPAKISDAHRETLKWKGRVRGMAYKVMLGTGLRYGELRSISIGALHLDKVPAYIELKAEHEKARRGARIALSDSLTAELADYLAERKNRATGTKKKVSITEINKKPLFELPKQLNRAFDADLIFAGIPKVDDRGKCLDVHAFRHTFVTWLASSGASVAVVQKAARHSDPKLTMGVYTHIGLEEQAAAMAKLPVIETKKIDTETSQEGDQVEEKLPKVSAKVSYPDGTTCQNMANNVNSEVHVRDYDKSVSACGEGTYGGGPCRDRTCDLVIKSHLLYRLS